MAGIFFQQLHTGNKAPKIHRNPHRIAS